MTKKRWAEAFIHSIMPASALLVLLLPAYWDAGGAYAVERYFRFIGQTPRSNAQKKLRSEGLGPVTSMVLSALFLVLLLAPLRLRC